MKKSCLDQTEIAITELMESAVSTMATIDNRYDSGYYTQKQRNKAKRFLRNRLKCYQETLKQLQTYYG